MKPLEPFVKAHNDELKVRAPLVKLMVCVNYLCSSHSQDFLGDLCDVPDFHEALQVCIVTAIVGVICILCNFKKDYVLEPGGRGGYNI